jgi:opacity protein-like surface antigen
MVPKMTVKLAVSMLLAACAAPAAAAVQYDFVGTSSFGGTYGSFSFTAPDFLNNSSTSGTLIPFQNLTSCSVTFGSGTCDAQLLANDSSGFTGQPSDVIGFGASGGQTTYYYFQDGALTTYGNYSSILLGPSQAGTLRVSLASTSAVPEPATWAMMLIGFVAIGSGTRRSRRKDGKLLQLA